MTTTPLTRRQRDILTFVTEYREEHNISPTLEEIAAHLGVDSLAYLTKEGMVEAAQANASNFCTACFDGAYPIEMDDSLRNSKLMLEPAGLAARSR